MQWGQGCIRGMNQTMNAKGLAQQLELLLEKVETPSEDAEHT